MNSTSFGQRALRVAAVVAALSIVGGCSHKKKHAATQQAHRVQQEPEVTDLQIVDAIRNSGVKSAIISQHTLFPYHFVQDGEALNELGQRDLSVLAGHLHLHAGELDMPRNGASAKLYDARVQTVMDALRAQGVKAEQVKVVDAIGGGATPSEDVMRDVRNVRTLRTQPQSAGTGAPVQSSGSVGGQQ